MGCFASLCSKVGLNSDEYAQYLTGRQTEDQNSLLVYNSAQPNDDLTFENATAPGPLLKDVDFAVVEDDNTEPSGSSEENAVIEKMLNEVDTS
jgi:hypothetical protein